MITGLKPVKEIVTCLVAFLTYGTMLAGCSPQSVPVLDSTQAFQTVAVKLTHTMVVSEILASTEMPAASLVPVVERDGTLQSSQAAIPLQHGEQASTSQPEVPCNRAAPGKPMDITIPDGTRLKPGEIFTKTWRLLNVGSCSWTTAYRVVWYSGQSFGAAPNQSLYQQVDPHNFADISIELVAPETPGIYQGNWKLRSETGDDFGIGPRGDYSFWVHIEVIPSETPTPEIVPSPTTAAVIASSGSVKLQAGDSIDLDASTVPGDSQNDLRFEKPDDFAGKLEPINNAMMGFYGFQQPEMVDCSSLRVTMDPVPIEILEVGTFLCFQTNQGLPGVISFHGIQNSTEPATLEFEYVTWATP